MKMLEAGLAGIDEIEKSLLDVLESVRLLRQLIDECAHEYKKTLDKSGMYFIEMCHKCHERRPFKLNAENSTNDS